MTESSSDLFLDLMKKVAPDAKDGAKIIADFSTHILNLLSSLGKDLEETLTAFKSISDEDFQSLRYRDEDTEIDTTHTSEEHLGSDSMDTAST